MQDTLLVKKILVREVADQTHTQLSEIANETGVSLNSIVKDALEEKAGDILEISQAAAEVSATGWEVDKIRFDIWPE